MPLPDDDGEDGWGSSELPHPDPSSPLESGAIDSGDDGGDSEPVELTYPDQVPGAAVEAMSQKLAGYPRICRLLGTEMKASTETNLNKILE